MKIFTVMPDPPIGLRINGSRFGVPGCAPTSYYIEKTMKASQVKNCRFRHCKKNDPRLANRSCGRRNNCYFGHELRKPCQQTHPVGPLNPV